MKSRRSTLILSFLALLIAATTFSIAQFTALALDTEEVNATAAGDTDLATVLVTSTKQGQMLIANDEPPTCYELSVSHDGSGTDPVASPKYSPECEGQGTGFYLAGTQISVSGAVPDEHWQIVGWKGTDNNASTAATNTLTMPASSAAVSVIYDRICFTLATEVSPASSGTIERTPLPGQSGCTGGKYFEGTTVSLTAKPATGYVFTSWSGANTSSNNPVTVVMNGDRAITANFTRACYKLVLTHTGSGADPMASPAKSDSCSAGAYYYNAEINLTAAPAPGWQVESWLGTNNDSSTSLNNVLTMPAEDGYAVGVNYIEKPTLQFAAESYSVNENDGTATIQVSRTGSLKESVSVKYATSNGTAKAGSDYESSSGTLTFARNVQQATFTVPIFNDNVAEGTENLNLSISDVTGGGKLGARTTAVLNILDDEGQPTVQFETTTYSVDEGAGTLPVNVTLFPPTVRSVIVDLKVDAGTATAGVDFTDVSDDIVFRAGDTSAVINVPVNDDGLDEPDETINLSLLNVEGAALGAAQSTITIVDNDDPPSIQFSSNEYFAEAGSDTAEVAVVLGQPSGQVVTVEYQIVDVSVGRNLDGVATLQPGEISEAVQVSIANKKPGDELVLVLENPDNAVLGAPISAKLYILDPNRSDCYPLTVAVTGHGSPPVASPDRSLSCPAGQYVEDAIITLRARLDKGWYVGGWQGTENDQTRPAPNETVVIMPGAEHVVKATYQTDHFVANIVDFAFFDGPAEHESNDERLDANGPIHIGNIYVGSFARKNGGTVRDVRDLYYLYLTEERVLEVLVTGIPQGHDYTLTVYRYPAGLAQDCPSTDPQNCFFGQSGTPGNRDEAIRKVFPAGHYVIQVYYEGGLENETRYQLTVRP